MSGDLKIINNLIIPELTIRILLKKLIFTLMHFMQEDYANEYKKMGGELKQTVEEIIEKIRQLEIDYR